MYKTCRQPQPGIHPTYWAGMHPNYNGKPAGEHLWRKYAKSYGDHRIGCGCIRVAVYDTQKFLECLHRLGIKQANDIRHYNGWGTKDYVNITLVKRPVRRREKR